MLTALDHPNSAGLRLGRHKFAFDRASRRVLKAAGGVDPGLRYGRLDSALAETILFEATSLMMTQAGWDQRATRTVSLSARWDLAVAGDLEYVKQSARAFLTTASELGLGIWPR